MPLTICFGMSLGVLLGLAAGSYLFSLMLQPRKYREVLDISADSNDEVIAPPQGTPITQEMRNLLPYTESWTEWPDSEKASMVNRAIAILWPHITRAGMKMGLGIAKDMVVPMLKDFPFVEDILLGKDSFTGKEVQHPVNEWVEGQDFTMGTIPLRLGGIKSYDTADDEVVLEVPLHWGSDTKFQISAVLNFGLFRLHVPLEIMNFQMKVDTRITLKPLVETLPCIGGMTVSLLKVPLVDMNLMLLKGIDLMSLPFAKMGLQMVMQKVLGDMLLYPSSKTIPIMPDFGLPPEPKGALKVRLISGSDIPSEESYIRLKTRPTKYHYSKPVPSTSGNPVYNQDFTLLVEDFEKQALELVVIHERNDTDMDDNILAEGSVAFGNMVKTGYDPATREPLMAFREVDFIRVPNRTVDITVPLKTPKVIEPDEKDMSQLDKATQKTKKVLQSFSGRTTPPGESAGKLKLRIQFIPFYQHVHDDEDEDKKKATKVPTQRQITHNVPGHLQGVLTVNIIRCINLKGEAPTTYVKVEVQDEHLNDCVASQDTQSVIADNSPRFGQKFDFVMIPASSVLIFKVMQKVRSGLFSKGRDVPLGALILPIKDVARNGMLKDVWNLVETEKGQIEIELKWLSCYINDDVDTLGFSDRTASETLR